MRQRQGPRLQLRTDRRRRCVDMIFIYIFRLSNYYFEEQPHSNERIRQWVEYGRQQHPPTVEAHQRDWRACGAYIDIERVVLDFYQDYQVITPLSTEPQQMAILKYKHHCNAQLNFLVNFLLSNYPQMTESLLFEQIGLVMKNLMGVTIFKKS